MLVWGMRASLGADQALLLAEYQWRIGWLISIEFFVVTL